MADRTGRRRERADARRRSSRAWRWVAPIAFLAIALPAEGRVEATPATACLSAARAAALRHDVPLALLWAVGLAESGRHGVAWPWTLNTEGHGRWFESEAAAAAALADDLAAGHWNVDVGCFQISTRWHGAAFEEPLAMLEPGRNADYAARFLVALHAETGDWQRASGLYHSRTPERAAAYRARVARLLPIAERALRVTSGPQGDSPAASRRLAAAPLPVPRPDTAAASPLATAGPARWLGAGATAPWFRDRLARAPARPAAWRGSGGGAGHWLSGGRRRAGRP